MQCDSKTDSDFDHAEAPTLLLVVNKVPYSVNQCRLEDQRQGDGRDRDHYYSGGDKDCPPQHWEVTPREYWEVEEEDRDFGECTSHCVDQPQGIDELGQSLEGGSTSVFACDPPALSP